MGALDKDVLAFHKLAEYVRLEVTDLNPVVVACRCCLGPVLERSVSVSELGFRKNQPALRNDLLFTCNKRCDAVFTMRDTLISYITPQLVPLYFRKGSLEGKHYTVDEVWYTYPGGKSHVRQKFLNRHGELSEHHHESNDCNYDMLSILSLARSFNPKNYKIGQRIHFPMATGKKVEEQTLVYRGKKDWKANDKKTYHCLIFSLLDYEEKDKDKELLRFYVTDDSRHMPVRIDFYLRFGTAKAYLAKSN